MKKKKRRIIYRETTYGSGPMDMAPDFGVRWREKLIPKLKALNIIFQDPVAQTLKLLKTDSMEESRTILQRLWRQDEEEYHRIMETKIEKWDIKAVLRSDFLITFWDWRVITYGTTVENDVAARNGIPIYCVSYAPAEALPNWLRKDIHKSGGGLFNSFDHLIEFLKLRRNVVLQYKRKALGF